MNKMELKDTGSYVKIEEVKGFCRLFETWLQDLMLGKIMDYFKGIFVGGKRGFV
jgi:hypothetical protein